MALLKTVLPKRGTVAIVGGSSNTVRAAYADA
jgi:hypothetical protein